jgi:NAD(P)-dependent dehydrogenase (short-subunit alcohol dehydrogenase family)
MDAKSIFVTGAGSGIGRAVALRFARTGWHVGLCDVDAEALEAVHARIGNDRASQHPADVTRSNEVRDAIDGFRARTEGRMDVLFLAAGVLHVGRFESIATDQHRRMLDVNVGGVVACLREAFPLLRATPGARAITMSSASATYGTPELASYSASKHAVRGLTEALNLEWAAHDIHVCDIMAPYVDSPMTRRANRAHSMDTMGIDLTPEDVAAVVERAANGPRRVHWPVGRSYRWLYRIADWLPSGINRLIMKRVAGF